MLRFLLDVADVTIFLGYYAALLGNRTPTLRGNLTKESTEDMTIPAVWG